MGFFITLQPLKPTERDVKYVKTTEYVQLCQKVAHKMITEGHGWDEIEVQLRDITVRALLPKRKYNPDEVADFYTNNWQLIDGTWLSTVQKMKEDYAAMAADPEKFLRNLGLLPSGAAGVTSPAALEKSFINYSSKSTTEKPVRSSFEVKDLKEGVDYV